MLVIVIWGSRAHVPALTRRRYSSHAMWWLFIPLIILGAALLLFRAPRLPGAVPERGAPPADCPRLSRFGFMRRFFTSISTAAIERQNPELAGAIRR